MHAELSLNTGDAETKKLASSVAAIHRFRQNPYNEDRDWIESIDYVCWHLSYEVTDPEDRYHAIVNLLRKFHSALI
jgi:hypothetical protein